MRAASVMLSRIILRSVLLSSLVCVTMYARTQQPDTALIVTLHAEHPGPVINRDIFGQFAEHLGTGIYGGVWVGRDSGIPNVRGIRSDVVKALREIRVPNVRWPGGCFADQYHWRNAIGPVSRRISSVNANWGGTLEPNSFGTDEFMDFVHQIGSEAYINVNVGSGTPQESAEWLEYMTTEQPSTLGKQRALNGHKEPYRIKYLGIGNESWGCGGEMSAEEYVERMRTFSLFTRSLNPAQAGPSRWQRGPDSMRRIAVGPEDNDTAYTEAVMKATLKSVPWRWGIEGLSLHHYVMGSTPLESPATGFSEKEYAIFVKQTLEMDGLIATNSAIMDQYDPKKMVALAVDEWGVWLKPTPGTNPSFLKQQNSLRDAILASLNLNIFARHADRVRLANIAQMVNVLQAMILTDEKKMLLTPTYQVFKMYVPFQDAQLIPIDLDRGKYRFGELVLPQVDAIAARSKEGEIWVALTNIDPNRPADITVKLSNSQLSSATGQALTAAQIDAVNSFDNPSAVLPQPFGAHATNGALVLHLSPKSVTVVRLQP
jgi:alpha-N-arabinofuranosidase